MVQRSVRLTLTEEEYEALLQAAQDEVRSPGDQVRYYVRRALGIGSFSAFVVQPGSLPKIPLKGGLNG